MRIQAIVQQALGSGYLTPAMEAEIGRICEAVPELTPQEYAALDQLMGALMVGSVVAARRKQFINVMEELVLGEALARAAEIEATSDRALDLGDIAAYALNRLPPLYATTEEGAEYQYQRAREELSELIATRVREAVSHHLDRPEGVSSRRAIGVLDSEVVRQIGSLLHDYATDYEVKLGSLDR
ncbi:late competence development protein comFB [Rubidibacter lacunae KORDI 51-2]|uniref:Late competence development protein comFB n=1 Tax=Rubidibacter lacunae KORDI 51-2 TaxID=582515 RepID=U5DHB4_9CHRO|nr:late competence development ComFB family protein [Rubidibacter lacunae]ERN39959.1 late competence development protein comFB [Rubidibacter lacunae KORDI 51-2]